MTNDRLTGSVAPIVAVGERLRLCEKAVEADAWTMLDASINRTAAFCGIV